MPWTERRDLFKIISQSTILMSNSSGPITFKMDAIHNFHGRIQGSTIQDHDFSRFSISSIGNYRDVSRFDLSKLRSKTCVGLSLYLLGRVVAPGRAELSRLKELRTESMLARTEEELLRRRLLRASEGSVGFKPLARAKMLRTSVKETTPERRPLIC